MKNVRDGKEASTCLRIGSLLFFFHSSNPKLNLTHFSLRMKFLQWNLKIYGRKGLINQENINPICVYCVTKENTEKYIIWFFFYVFCVINDENFVVLVF